jgi:hypothetical protein
MALYNQYYSSADCIVSMLAKRTGNEIILDKLNGILLAEESTAYPIYGLGDSKLGFITQGNYLVNGFIDINFIHATYLSNVISKLNQAPNKASKDQKVLDTLDSIEDLANLSIEDLVGLKLARDQQVTVGKKNGIMEQRLEVPFNIKVVMDNSSVLRKDNLASEFIIEDVRILSSELATSVTDESQVVRRYKFIARDLYEQSR